VEVRLFLCTAFVWLPTRLYLIHIDCGGDSTTKFRAGSDRNLASCLLSAPQHPHGNCDTLLRNIERNALSLQYDTHGDCRNVFAVLCLFILYFNFLSIRMYYQEGHSIVEAVCPWFLTAKTKRHFLVSRWGICGRQSANEADFSPSTSVFPCHCHSKNASHLFNHQSPML